MRYDDEIPLYFENLYMHVYEFVERLRLIPDDQFDYCPGPGAPTPRLLATHMYQWLVCDRQHIMESDAAKHPLVPDAPAEPSALCDALQTELAAWRRLFEEMTPEQLAEPRSQFNQFPMNVRGFIGHILQNSIYKNGQLATIFFALGLDGTEPYDAPFPNVYYRELAEAKAA